MNKTQSDWDAFCAWIREYMELPKLPIEWSRYEKDGFKIVRIDLFKDKPYHVITALEDRDELCTDGVAYMLAMGLMPVLCRAIETNTAYTYFRHFRLQVV